MRSVLNRAGLTTEDGTPLVWWCQRPGQSDASAWFRAFSDALSLPDTELNTTQVASSIANEIYKASECVAEDRNERKRLVRLGAARFGD
jgi:hypothetical protein